MMPLNLDPAECTRLLSFSIQLSLIDCVCVCVLQAGAEISTVHPEQYAKRFREFITKIFA